jgi:SOS-response transcriptional repressor LexA
MFNKERFSELLLSALGDRTKEDYAQESGVSRGYISKCINMRIENPPSPDILKRLAEASGNKVTYEDLMEVAGYIKNVTISVQPAQAYTASKPSLINKIPILGRIRAGLPLLASENFEGEIDLTEDIKADFALRVEGDSMSWVGIADGDLALFTQSSTAQQGDIVAAGVEDDEWCATLKFYIKENSGAVLRAANPNYKDMPITEKHRIIGTLEGIYKESPSIMDYKKFLIDKELNDKGWTEAIEKATQYGLESKQLIQLIELFSHMVKHIK